MYRGWRYVEEQQSIRRGAWSWSLKGLSLSRPREDNYFSFYGYICLKYIFDPFTTDNFYRISIQKLFLINIDNRNTRSLMFLQRGHTYILKNTNLHNSSQYIYTHTHTYVHRYIRTHIHRFVIVAELIWWSRWRDENWGTPILKRKTIGWPVLRSRA